MNIDKQSKCGFIIDHFGVDNQKLKLVEEIGELIVALMKEKHSDIVNELADVYVMLEQMKQYYNVYDSQLDEAIHYKIQRTIERYGIKC